MNQFKWLLLLAAIILLMASCPSADPLVDNGQDNGNEPQPIGDYSGTASASAHGFASQDPAYLVYPLNNPAPGRQITVTITMENGFIKEVDIDAPDESKTAPYNFTSRLLENAPAVIIARNTFDLERRDIDGASGATRTFTGIMEAGNSAIDKIMAGDFD